MKKYNTNFIKSYIEKHKEEIKSVDCGMKEDWSWTAGTVFKDGKFSYDYDWSKESISVAGISGSNWATPVMKVEFKDGRMEIVDCYVDDGEKASQSQIAQNMEFARATGGMDYVQ